MTELRRSETQDTGTGSAADDLFNMVLLDRAQRWADLNVTCEGAEALSLWKLKYVPRVTRIDTSRLSGVLHEFHYDEDFPLDTKYLRSPPARFINDSSVQDTRGWSQSFTTSSSFMWSVTEGLTITTTVSGDVKLPFVSGGKVEFSTQLSFSATQEQTKSQTQTWTESAEISVPARSIIDISIAVGEVAYSPNWKGKVALSGPLSVWAKSVRKDGGPELWPPLPEYEYSHDLMNLLNRDPRLIYERDAVLVPISGLFNGQQGIQSNIYVKEYPLKSDAANSSPIAEGFVMPDVTDTCWVDVVPMLRSLGWTGVLVKGADQPIQPASQRIVSQAPAPGVWVLLDSEITLTFGT
jgi:hypothetical protein